MTSSVRKGSRITAVEIITFIGEDDQDVSKRAHSYIIDFAFIFSRAGRKRDRRIVTQLVDLVAYKFFEMNILRGCITRLTDSENATKRNTRDLMKDDGLPRVLVRGSIRKKDGCAP